MITIDHTGDYSWQGSVVIPALPDSYATGRRVEGGEADVTNFLDSLTKVDGGFVLAVNFTVNSFSGSPVLRLVNSVAFGTATTIVPG